jgi:hypothetical protein
MYVRLVSVQDSSCETPGSELYRIFRAIIITGWISQAPRTVVSKWTPHVQPQPDRRTVRATGGQLPFKLTQLEFQFGRADWSLSSMTVSGKTSWMMLVDLDRRRVRVSLMPMWLLAEWVRTRDPGTDILQSYTQRSPVTRDWTGRLLSGRLAC